MKHKAKKKSGRRPGRMKGLLACVTAAVMLLTGCGAPALEGFRREEMKEAWRGQVRFEPADAEAEHGADGVIQWQDAGVEARVRSLLERPEGDILRSDVWALTELELVGAGDLPAVTSLEDLRHFDSLQSLRVDTDVYSGSPNGIPQETPLTTLQGLEQCTGLRYLELNGLELQELEPLRGLIRLEQLCVTNNRTPVQLTALQQLPALRVLYLDDSEVVSLEPLASVAALKVLSMRETRYPSLEPLAESGIEYLQMRLNGIHYLNTNTYITNSEEYAQLDYTPLTRMQHLVWLDVAHHEKNVDEQLVTALLQQVETLRWLNLYNTKAARCATLPVESLTGLIVDE